MTENLKPRLCDPIQDGVTPSVSMHNLSAPLNTKMWNPAVYVVMSEHTLGALCGRIYLEPQGGYHKPIDGAVCWYGDSLRPATLNDFDLYRVSPPEGFTDEENASRFPLTIPDVVPT